jgi:hypothetical protein
MIFSTASGRRLTMLGQTWPQNQTSASTFAR